MFNGRTRSTAILSIFLFLQAWADVWIDAVTETHYWNMERNQLEHVPDDVQWEPPGIPNSFTSSAKNRKWAEDPCPVPSFIGVSSMTEVVETCLLDVAGMGDNVSAFGFSSSFASQVLPYAPKQSPPDSHRSMS